MNESAMYQTLLEEFDLKNLPEEDREDMLLEVAKTIHKQFLLEVYDVVGETNFNAIQASAKMGDEFYQTTIKHLVPNYEELFISAKEKVRKAFLSSEQ